MYNKQLDTFIRVADAGSFTKAADILYITPSAIIQQINMLESNLNTSLFTRSNRGVKLTSAGELLYNEAKIIIDRCNDIRKHIGLIDNRSFNSIRVGTGLLSKCRLFYDYWYDFTKDKSHMDYEAQFKQVKLGVNFEDYYDIIECVDYKGVWQRQDNLEFLEIYKVPIGCAVPKGHPLSTRELITIDDLKGSIFLNSPLGLEKEFDDLQNTLIQNGIKVINPDEYGESTFSTCKLNNYIMQTPLCWHDIHPDFVTIPVDWDYDISYGFYFSKNCNKMVREFLDFVRESDNKIVQLYKKYQPPC